MRKKTMSHVNVVFQLEKNISSDVYAVLIDEDRREREKNMENRRKIAQTNAMHTIRHQKFMVAAQRRTPNDAS